MPVVSLGLPQSGYDIVIEPGSLAQVGFALRERGLGQKSPKVLVVSHPSIFRHYGEPLMAGLRGAEFEPYELLLPPGERYKTASTLHKIYDRAQSCYLERSSLMLALGGGVIGDMTGFAAATWLRGINFVQVPTSLLAMVDAAIGGKTGINHAQGKNLIGAFHQPRLVWIDPRVLQTLPPREFRAAMAEVIKYGVIWDAQLFHLLESLPHLDQRRYFPPPLLTEIITRCAQAKAEIVMKDEKESGLRALLNFGHTIGHGIETATHYKINHGEAVAIGMVLASLIAVQGGFWSEDCHQRLVTLISKAKLPYTIPSSVDSTEIVRALLSDKKVEGGKLRFVLPTTIGAATVTDTISIDLVKEILAIGYTNN
ncbi:MAG: 3-dehydroquinate synthase [Pseudanabaenaceae cyanobacterium SKYGB_i_bin29]|nr:3-dehydroquinate synthase [Pseudanabaenaceae cyanobacterium SKYG29]MDW8421667.1 3-dehydroquinate synthase [Pseudanabaenaceae cyanobacterium SKYGB_i_bin29]